MTNEWMRFGTGLIAAVVLAGSLTGCNDALQMQNRELMVENTALRGEIDDLRRAQDDAINSGSANAAELERMRAELEALRNARNNAPQPPVNWNSAGGFEGIAGVEQIQGRGTTTVRVPGDALFSSGKADLRTSSKQTLGQVAQVLRSQYSTNQIRVEGHSDGDPIKKSKWRDNYHLAEARATAVRDYLATQGVERSRMSIVSHGPDKPVADNKSIAGKAKNRRVEIVVVVPN